MMTRTARISECGMYRYGLGRQWTPPEESKHAILWVMLNPSTADAEKDDPTIRQCIHYSQVWGFHAMLVANLFAYRATDPKDLLKAQMRGFDIIGPECNKGLLEMSSVCAYTCFAWGTHALAKTRGFEVAKLLGPTPSLKVCLGVTKNGSPKHPLYLKGDLKPVLVRGISE
jgi:hypothetical protein